jgi:hypothetical protein
VGSQQGRTYNANSVTTFDVTFAAPVSNLQMYLYYFRGAGPGGGGYDSYSFGEAFTIAERHDTEHGNGQLRKWRDQLPRGGVEPHGDRDGRSGDGRRSGLHVRCGAGAGSRGACRDGIRRDVRRFLGSATKDKDSPAIGTSAMMTELKSGS